MEKKCVHHNKLLCRNHGKAENGTVSSESRPRSGRVRRMKLFVSPTTGGCFEVCVSPQETVSGLKQTLSRKFKIPPGRINLLFKNRVLKDGSLQENGITEGSRIVLCPNMESGTTSHRAEHSVIQALQNLSDSQVSDFLSGKAPLTLAIRLGEHLMFVQLQLSTVSARPSQPQPQPTPPPSPTPTPTTTSTTPNAAGPAGGVPPRSAFAPTVNPVSLVQASHNLTEKLKELTRFSQERLQTRGQVPKQPVPTMPLTPPPSPPPSPGAVIDSMQHLGKGVYSGTFSGTLDPRLQDMSGRPRCDVNTILHILHDLLVAQPSGHMTRPAQHRHGNQTPPPRRFFPEENVSEDTALRDKVQRIQMMLEERRQRRLARRNNQRPYPPRQHLAKCASSLHPHSSSPDSICSCQRPPTPLTPNPDNTAASTTPTTAANHAENMETTNYRKPNMEQETVAV